MRGPFTHCKCGRPIVWLRTRKDKPIPCLRERTDGEQVKPGEIFDRQLHRCHWEDCPEAGSFRKKPQAQEPAAPSIIGITCSPGVAWGILGQEQPVIPRTDYCLGRPGQFLAIHDGGAVMAVARYQGRTEDGEGWILVDVRPITPIPWPPGEGQWGLPEALLGKVRAAWKEAPKVEVKTSQPAFPWGDT